MQGDKYTIALAFPGGRIDVHPNCTNPHYNDAQIITFVDENGITIESNAVFKIMSS